MARANTATKKEEKKDEKNYVEFDVTAPNGNIFEGRVYKEAHIGDKGAWHAISITVNGITIKGAKLWIPSDESKARSILWPSYKDKDGKFQPFIMIFKKEDADDLDAAISKMAELLGY